MHPALWAWHAARPTLSKCCYRGWGYGHRHHGRGHSEEAFEEGPGGGGGFGVRRPLRFLAHKLNLDERQVTELARILNELKTERAQAEVDHRRTVTAFADALAGETFDAARAAEGGNRRVQSAERLRDAVLAALRQLHGLLRPEQRDRLACS
jgi:Spy/CpxP family protein refolding chaperone